MLKKIKIIIKIKILLLILITDYIQVTYNQVTFLNSCRFINGRLTRWALSIQDYRLKMTYIPGEKNACADTLSRLPGHIRTRERVEINKILLTRTPGKKIMSRLQNQQKEQSRDTHIQKSKLGNKITIRKGLACKNMKIILPKTLVKNLIWEIHELYGHIGATKCARMILKDFYVPNLVKVAKSYPKTYDSCQRNKTYTGCTFALTRSTVTTRKGELLSLNYIGPFQGTSRSRLTVQISQMGQGVRG